VSSAVDLDPEPARTVATLAHERGSGVLSCVRGKGRRLVCVVDGALAHVASNAIEEQVEAHLVREQLLGGNERATLRAEALSQRRGIAALLAERPGADRQAIERVLRERNHELFLRALDAADAEYRFERGTPNLGAELIVPQPCLPLVFAHALRPVRPIDVVRIRIGPPGIRIHAAADVEARLGGIVVPDAAKQILVRCQEARSLGEIVGPSPEDEAGTLRVVYGLLLIGGLEPADGAQPSRAARSDVVSRDEAQARVGRALGADHYAVLGVKTDCALPEIRDAYYFLARRYHPDRFRTGPLGDMLGEIEHYFRQVTEAYNTLIDPQRRKQYDDEASERILGARKDPQQDVHFLAKQNHVRGLRLSERRQYVEAVRSFENAIQLDPSKATYHLDLGRVLVLHPLRRADAEVALSKAVELDPALVDGYLALADLYRRLDRPDDAMRMYREALRWDPDHADAADGLRELSPRGRS
jgi:tetratricopeptide (TPR) repeat protein